MNGKDEAFQIKPETRIGALLECYPALEETLLRMAPEFSQLRDPLLRKTIAKVASLSQVAAIGKVSLPDMINALRREVGITEEFSSGPKEAVLSPEKPTWVATGRVAAVLDARPMLEAGEHPVQRVLAEGKKLEPGEIFVLITPFVPEPLIEAALKQGLRAWVREEAEAEVKTYLTPDGNSSGG
jgi:hypothetical protein